MLCFIAKQNRMYETITVLYTVTPWKVSSSKFSGIGSQVWLKLEENGCLCLFIQD